MRAGEYMTREFEPSLRAGLRARTLRKGMAAVALGAALTVLGACQTMGGGEGAQTANPLSDMDTAQRTLYEAGRDAESRHKYDLAANAYGRLYERRPNDPDVLAAFIRNMRYTGNVPQILGYIENKTQHLIDHPYVKFEYAKALIAGRRAAEAVVHLRALQNGDLANDWRIYSALGIALDAQRAFPQAIVAYGQALRLSPDNTVVMNNLAMSQAMSGQLGSAIATLERAAVLDRSNQQIRQNLALLYAVNGDAEKARSLAAMDLDSADLETNMTFYRRFEGGDQ